MLDYINKHLALMQEEVFLHISEYNLSPGWVRPMDYRDYFNAFNQLDGLGDPLSWRLFTPPSGFCMFVTPRHIQVHVFNLRFEELPLYINAPEPYLRFLVSYRLREAQ